MSLKHYYDNPLVFYDNKQEVEALNKRISPEKFYKEGFPKIEHEFDPTNNSRKQKYESDTIKTDKETSL